MCRTPDDVKFFGRAPLGDPTAGMTDSEQAAYWRASRDRIAAQNMELGAKLERKEATFEALTKALENIAQRANESGTGELALLDTIHAMHAIARDAVLLSRSEA